jgi:ABC-2 family transporter
LTIPGSWRGGGAGDVAEIRPIDDLDRLRSCLTTEDALAPVVNAVALPLLLMSGILLPHALAPDWLKFLSTLNPLTHAADAARALFNGDWANPEIAIGTAVMGALAVFAVWLASRGVRPGSGLSLSRGPARRASGGQLGVRRNSSPANPI